MKKSPRTPILKRTEDIGVLDSESLHPHKPIEKQSSQTAFFVSTQMVEKIIPLS